MAVKKAGEPAPASPGLGPPAATLSLTPAFKLIFFSVLGLTVLSLVASFVLVIREQQTEETKRLAETCSTTWKLGFGAIVGLIGGKAL